LGYDRALDGIKNEGNAFAFYSLMEDQPMVIQARPLPFDPDDVVPLGFHSPVAGNFRIGIDSHDEFFTGRAVYLEDLELNRIHDLKLAPYHFQSDAGRFEERFQLRFSEQALGLNQNHETADLVYIKGDQLIYNGSEELEQITLFDITGKKIGTFTNHNGQTAQQWNIHLAQALYIGTLEYSDGSIRSVKLIRS
jgi:hypothetical protein